MIEIELGDYESHEGRSKARSNIYRDEDVVEEYSRSQGKKNLYLTLMVIVILLYCFWPTKPPSYTVKRTSSVDSNTVNTEIDLSLNERIRRIKEEYLNVAITYDTGEYNLGMKALMNSIILNTDRSNHLYFHFIIDATVFPARVLQATQFISELELVFLTQPETRRNHICFDLSIFSEWERVKHLYTGSTPSTKTRFGNPLNVARLYLDKLFPMVKGKMLSLDTDQLVLGDIGELIDSANLTNVAFASTFSEKAKPLSYYLNLEHPILKDMIDNNRIDLSRKVFGGGLFIMNLEEWKKRKYIEEIEKWCVIHQRSLQQQQKPLLAQKTLKKTLLNMVLNSNDSVVFLDSSWNSGDCNTAPSLLNLQQSSQHIIKVQPAPSPTATDLILESSSGDITDSSKIKILHFAGFNGKPWDPLASCHPFLFILWEYYYKAIPYQH